MTHVCIAEDKGRVRQALERDLATISGLQLTGSYPNGRAIVDGLAALDHLPDVILMDIDMPELDGIGATAAIKARHPQIKILMLTVFEEEEQLFRAVRAGADGYLLKGVTPETLESALADVLAGGVPMTPLIARKALRLIGAAPLPTAPPPGEPLSAREREVLEQLSKGLRYRDVAANLHLSVGTVRKHVEHIYRKLRVSNKVDAVAAGQARREI